MEEQRDQNRRKFNMIFLYLQKKEIYNNYKYVGPILEKNYFLTNKSWFEKYKNEFKFDEIEFNEEYSNLLYDKAKENYSLKELNKNGTPFQDMHSDLNNYKKEEDKIIKDNYEINVPLNIELLYEDYVNNYMQGINNNFGFEHVKVYLKEDTMLIVKSENKQQIFICDLRNDEDEFIFSFGINVEGIIILEKIDLDDIINKISAFGIQKYLKNNKINKGNEKIQNIINNKGEVIAKYIKYIKSKNDNNNKEDMIEEDNNQIHKIEVENEDVDRGKKNKKESSISEKSEIVNEEDEGKEENEEEEGEEEEEEEKDDINEFIKLYWKYVPDFYFSEVLNQSGNNQNPNSNNIPNNRPNNQPYKHGNNYQNQNPNNIPNNHQNNQPFTQGNIYQNPNPNNIPNKSRKYSSE